MKERERTKIIPLCPSFEIPEDTPLDLRWIKVETGQHMGETSSRYFAEGSVHVFNNEQYKAESQFHPRHLKCNDCWRRAFPMVGNGDYFDTDLSSYICSHPNEITYKNWRMSEDFVRYLLHVHGPQYCQLQHGSSHMYADQDED